MKKLLSILVVFLLGAVTTMAQNPSPGIFNYQGVARNSVGNVLVNQSISLRLTIHDGAPAGPVVYQEVRGVTTNPFGLFNAQVGSAGFTSQIGTIAGITWGGATTNKYIQVEIDPAGGSTFINIGTAQIASVPYSLYTSLANDLVLPFIRTQSDAGPLFKLTNSANGAGSTAYEGLTNSLANNVSAIIGTVTTASAGSFSAGVRGINNGNAGNGIGVWGSQNGTGWGVYGTTPGGIGVYGLSTTGTGTQGSSTSGNGVVGTSTSGIGVFGTSNTGNGGRFENTNAANGADALQASTNGTASSWALRATSTGAQGAGIFVYNNAGGSANALRVTNNGSGAAISATASNSGSAGLFNNTNAGNASSTVVVTSNSNNGVGLQVNMTGTSQVSAVYGNISTTANASAGISGADFSSGGASGIEARTYGVVGQTGTTGIGVGGYANTGGTALRGFGGGPTGYALTTNSGRVQFAGIGENLNWILRSDAAGNATWANPAILLGPLFWSTTGNTGTVDGTNFIGNIDNVPFNIRVNNQRAGRLDQSRNNTFYGLLSGSANYTTVGSENTGIGVNALFTNTTGTSNTAIGSGVLYLNTTGTDNTGTGRFALYNTSTGSFNSAHGRQALISNTTGNYNTGSGWDALYNNTTGNNNSGIGDFSLITNTTGSKNTGLGSQADVASGALTNATAIGANASVSTSNSLVLGSINGVNLATASVNVGIGTTAPAYKLDVVHGGSTGIRDRSLAGFSVVDIDANNGDAALRFQRAGVSQWNTRNNPGTDDYQIFEMGGGGERMQIQDATGNVGIGNISPAYRLDVQHGGATGAHIVSTASFSVVDIDAANGDAALRFQSAGVNQWNTRNRPSDNYYEWFEMNGGGSRMAIQDGTGNVGIGNTSASIAYRLDVQHGGATGIRSQSTSSFSVVDIDAANGDAALRFQRAGVGQWNTRNRPADDYYEIFELGGGGSRVVIQDATGNVGIGETVNPTYKLDVLHAGSTGIRSRSSASFSVVDIDAASGDAALRFQAAGVGQWNTRNRPADNYYEIFELGGGGSRVVIQDGTGNVGIGQTVAPAYKLDVQHGGATGIRSQSTASFSVVDIDAASGDAALRFQAAGVNQWNMRNRPGDNYLEIFELGGGGSRMAIQDATGNVGIGTTGAGIAYRLDVQHGGATGLRVQSTATFSIIDIDGANGDAALRFANAGVNQWNTRNNPATNDYQIFELGGGGERIQIQDGSGNVGIGGVSPAYRLDVLHGGATGIRSRSSATFSVIDIDGFNGDAALRFQRAGVNQWNTRNNPATDDYQIFELGGGGERMRIENTTGNIVVSQNFTVLGVKAFTMDHPLDPANKLLRHAAAESNEVINFYSGNITTDGSGKAIVQLPDYYQALNKDSRYQLTVIGSFAQAIISKEVSNNTFEIATSVPNVKVSWEVKGVRNDARMQQHPFVAVEEKSAAQKGKYWDPAAHNQPASKGVSYDGSIESSLQDVKVSPAKAANPLNTSGGSLDQPKIVAPANKVATTGGSLDQSVIVAPANKTTDKTGSVEDVQAAKTPVKTLTTDGSVAPVETQKKAEVKPVEVKGTSLEEMKKPVIQEKKPAVDAGSTKTE